jgi:hypothetical protein
MQLMKNDINQVRKMISVVNVTLKQLKTIKNG